MKSLIKEAKAGIAPNVNSTMVLTDVEIGRIMVEDEQNGKYEADYAKKILAQLSDQLTKEHGKGYSTSNLEYIRKFYLIYNKRIPTSLIRKSGKPKKTTSFSIPQSLVEESKTLFLLSRTHYIQLLRIENNDERNFYEIEAAHGNWSVGELQRQRIFSNTLTIFVFYFVFYTPHCFKDLLFRKKYHKAVAAC